MTEQTNVFAADEDKNVNFTDIEKLKIVYTCGSMKKGGLNKNLDPFYLSQRFYLTYIANKSQ